MNLPAWAKLLILAAWQALKITLLSVGVPPIVVSAIEAVLHQLGILGMGVVTHEEACVRAAAIHEHVKGLGSKIGQSADLVGA